VTGPIKDQDKPAAKWFWEDRIIEKGHGLELGLKKGLQLRSIMCTISQ
jgi:hypothetical protein